MKTILQTVILLLLQTATFSQTSNSKLIKKILYNDLNRTDTNTFTTYEYSSTGYLFKEISKTPHTNGVVVKTYDSKGNEVEYYQNSYGYITQRFSKYNNAGKVIQDSTLESSGNATKFYFYDSKGRLVKDSTNYSNGDVVRNTYQFTEIYNSKGILVESSSKHREEYISNGTSYLGRYHNLYNKYDKYGNLIETSSESFENRISTSKSIRNYHYTDTITGEYDEYIENTEDYFNYLSTKISVRDSIVWKDFSKRVMKSYRDAVAIDGTPLSAFTKYETIEYDENYSVEFLNGKPYNKLISTYDTEGKLIFKSSERWLNGNWTANVEERHIYNKEGNPTEDNKFFYFSGQSTPYSVNITLYEYDHDLITYTRELNTDLLSISPNPATDKIYLKNKIYNNSSYSIIDVSGKILYQGLIYDEQLDISKLEMGVFHLQIQTSKGILSKNFIKN